MTPSWDDEADLLADLSAALAEATQVPEDFLVAARGALAWRDVDVDLALAELTFDSAQDEALATRSRGDVARTLAFDGGGFSVEIEVTGAGITGQVTPAVPAGITCQTAVGGEVAETTTDSVGCFVLAAPSAGPMRLRLRAGGRTVATTWVCLG
jgi:hypothetical protein